jgi:C-terminal processing protease CtpA/Prc
MVVLLDRESASSAEIVAWTLGRRHGAVVLGDRSAGKVRGSVLIPLVAGGGQRFVPFGIQVTVFDIVLPGDVRLEGPGLRPDTLVLPDAGDLAEERDPVLQRALALAGVTMSSGEAGRWWR